MRAAAERLHVHVQTVRYRLGQLRELYGDELDDPVMRLELELALRAAALPARPAVRRRANSTRACSRVRSTTSSAPSTTPPRISARPATTVVSTTEPEAA